MLFAKVMYGCIFVYTCNDHNKPFICETKFLLLLHMFNRIVSIDNNNLMPTIISCFHYKSFSSHNPQCSKNILFSKFQPRLTLLNSLLNFKSLQRRNPLLGLRVCLYLLTRCCSCIRRLE